MADPPCDDAPRNCVMFAPSLALVGLGHRRDLPGIELVDVVDQIVGESLLRIELLLDDVLLERPIVVRLIFPPDAFAPPLAAPVVGIEGPRLGAGVEQFHLVGEGSRLVDPVSCVQTLLPTDYPTSTSRSAHALAEAGNRSARMLPQLR